MLLRSHGGGTDTEIRVNTESRPWRRKFSRRSSRDSNPRSFNHDSGALTTELSPLPPGRPDQGRGGGREAPQNTNGWPLCSVKSAIRSLTCSCYISILQQRPPLLQYMSVPSKNVSKHSGIPNIAKTHNASSSNV